MNLNLWLVLHDLKQQWRGRNRKKWVCLVHNIIWVVNLILAFFVFPVEYNEFYWKDGNIPQGGLTGVICNSSMVFCCCFKLGFMWIPNFVCLQMACIRARALFCSVWARRSETYRVLCPAGRWSGCWSGWKLLFRAGQTTWSCALCGRCLPHWLGIKRGGKVESCKNLSLK